MILLRGDEFLIKDEIQKCVDVIFSEMIDELKAPVDIISIANKYGFTVYQSPTLECTSGIIIIDDKNIPEYDTNKVILINQKESFERKRFIIAYELGHYFMENKPKKHFARRDDTIYHKNDVNSFANVLLMPTGLIRYDFSLAIEAYKDFNTVVLILAKKYNVSKAVMRMHLNQLYVNGLI